MIHEIDKYMTVGEAAERWDVPQETIKNKLKPSFPAAWSQAEEMLKEGLIKYFQPSGKKQRMWIVSEDAMKKWFGENKNNL